MTNCQKLGVLALSLFTCSTTAFTATYYVDYSGGADANNGTSKSTPWKKCPGMSGFSGSYSHAAGDRFIFRGGVSWPATSIGISNSGSVGNYDYYGVDQTWFSGSSWNKPVFDAQSAMATILTFGGSASYVQVDNIDFRNTRFGSSAGYIGTISLSGNHDILLSNLWVHSWTRTTPTDGYIGGIINNPVGNGRPITNVKLDHCDIGNPENGGNIGACTMFIGEIAFCKLHHASQGILHGGQNVHDTEFYGINYSFDPNNHTNVAYLNKWNGAGLVAGIPCYFWNNFIHDCAAPELIYPNMDGAGNKDFYIYNNVVMACPSPVKTIDVDTYNDHLSGGTIRFFIYNNTFESTNPGNTFIRVSDRRPIEFPPSLVEYRNNQFIGPGAINGGPVTTWTYSNNIQHASLAAAAAAGYQTAAFYAPSGNSGPTMGTGINLLSSALGGIAGDTSRGNGRTPILRPTVGVWDIGAYQHGSGGLPVPTPTSTPSPSVAPSPTPSATATPTATAAPSASPMAGLSFGSTAGDISDPFTTNSDNTVSQSAETVDPTQGGKAAYTFNIDNAGDYVVAAYVDAPSLGNNSFFVNIDSEPTDPIMIWDVPVTSGLEQRTVSWRGNGTDVTSQFDPKVFTLTKGSHQLIIRGREAGTKIQQIIISKMPAPPSNLHPVGS